MTKMAHQHRIKSGSPNSGTPIDAMPHHPGAGYMIPGRDPGNRPAAASRQPMLTPEQVFRLWRCAIKDDDDLVDELIERVYENIFAFNDKRAESVIELMVRRSITARGAFRTLLKDMCAQTGSAPAASDDRSLNGRWPQRQPARPIAR